MLKNMDAGVQTGNFPNKSFPLKSITVRPIRPGERERWNALMREHHYLGFHSLVGESMKYVAEAGGEWVALLGWGASAFKCGARDRWIGWSKALQWARLKYIANNMRFLILPGERRKNLASRVLGMNVRRLSSDWEAVQWASCIDGGDVRGPTEVQGDLLPGGGVVGVGRYSGIWAEREEIL